MSRVALVFFLVFYTAYEVTIGLGTGVLVDYTNGLPPAEQAAVADAIQHYNGNAILADPSISLRLGFPGVGRSVAGGRGRPPWRWSQLAGDRSRGVLGALRHSSAAGRSLRRASVIEPPAGLLVYVPNRSSPS